VSAVLNGIDEVLSGRRRTPAPAAAAPAVSQPPRPPPLNVTEVAAAYRALLRLEKKCEAQEPLLSVDELRRVRAVIGLLRRSTDDSGTSLTTPHYALYDNSLVTSTFTHRGHDFGVPEGS
jgi:hypothetical protein